MNVIGYGCWKCGSVESRVVDSDVDEDGVRVRLRHCSECGSYWDTEERRLSRGAYYGRAVNRRKTEARRYKTRQHTCRVCGGPFRGGTYAAHKTLELHVRAVEARKEKRRLQMRLASRRWYEQDRRNRRAMQRLAA